MRCAEGVWGFCSVPEWLLLALANGPKNHNVEACVGQDSNLLETK